MDLIIVGLLVLSPVLFVLARIVFVPNGIGFEDLLRRTDLDWPHGVQEEEPVPWDLARWHSGSVRDPARRPAVPARRATGHRA